MRWMYVRWTAGDGGKGGFIKWIGVVITDVLKKPLSARDSQSLSGGGCRGDETNNTKARARLKKRKAKQSKARHHLLLHFSCFFVRLVSVVLLHVVCKKFSARLFKDRCWCWCC